MQRVYGVAFATPKELRQHLDMLEEAKKRDHRRLGKELDLFTFSDLVGAGLPLFTPRGHRYTRGSGQVYPGVTGKGGLYARVDTGNCQN